MQLGVIRAEIPGQGVGSLPSCAWEASQTENRRMKKKNIVYAFSDVMLGRRHLVVIDSKAS